MSKADRKRLADLFREIGRDLVNIRWAKATKEQKQEWGRKLGKASKAAWAKMTAEERSIEMTRRARVREENRRKREAAE